jgi:hypothetical protein
MLVSATVLKVHQRYDDKAARCMCRLENGLDATINENDANFFDKEMNKGSIVQGRVHQIKCENLKEEGFSVTLKCKPEDLRNLDIYVA